MRDMTLRLLGEELFDYRMFLHAGDDKVLRVALGELARLCMPVEIVAMRKGSVPVVPEISCTPFAGAPIVRFDETTAEAFCQEHGRLARNLRRLSALGYEVRRYNGENPQLLRDIYSRKAAQDPRSLFHDSLRIEFLINAALLRPELFEIFTLENEGRLGAALVTLCDQGDAECIQVGLLPTWLNIHRLFPSFTMSPAKL